MTDRPLVAIPVKSFSAAKRRLSSSLMDSARRQLGVALAARTGWVARDAGADVVIIAGTPEVADWAAISGFDVVEQATDDPGLDGAARCGIAAATAAGWRGLILHADLPCVTAPELRRCLATDGPLIVPSHDGGTALLGGVDTGFAFAYGPGSFHRHLAAAPTATVMSSPALALDLDRPRDLTRALAMPAGRWLWRYLEGTFSEPA